MAKPSLGNRTQHTFQPTKWATDEMCKTARTAPTTIFRQLRRLLEVDGGYPRLGYSIAWGYYSLASFAGLLDISINKNID